MTGPSLWYSATTADLTPRVSVPLGGYLARGDATATGTHDPLTASLLLLSGESGTEGVCWVAVDALLLDTGTCGRIATAVAAGTGLTADSVLVCCSHTHSGPGTWCRTPHLHGSNPQADPAAIDRVVADIGRAAARLPATRSRARTAWSVAPNAGVGSNRYDPAGPHDPSTGVLTVRDEWDVVVAVLFDYACHPTVLGHDNLEYSADYPHATRRMVGAALREIEELETPPVVAFLQGAAGDVSTRFTRRSQTFAEADRQGGMLSGALLRGLLGAEYAPPGVPSVHRGSARIPTRALPSPDEVEARVAATAAEWAEFGDAGTPAARIARTRHEGALLLRGLLDARVPAELELPVSVVTLGEIAWVHLPVEPFTSFAAAIRAASPFPHTRVIGYTDGYFGYLADAEGHANGVYEALSSVFDPAGGDALVAHAVELLRASH